MERIETPPGAAKSVVLTIAVILAGIVMGRLVMERTGAGLVAFALALPVVFIVASSLLGIGRAAVLLGLFATVALLMRVIVLQAGWIVLLLAPVIALTAFVLARTIRLMRRGADAREGGE